MPAIGHLNGGRDDLTDLEGGDGDMAEGDGLEAAAGAAAGAAAEAAGVAAGITGGGGGGCECIITTGEWYGGKGKASFFLIKSSQSSCFNCSSTISLESTSLN